MTWTRQLPLISGFYWYREGQWEPEVVHFDLGAFDKGPSVAFFDLDNRAHPTELTGEFWLPEIKPPT